MGENVTFHAFVAALHGGVFISRTDVAFRVSRLSAPLLIREARGAEIL